MTKLRVAGLLGAVMVVLGTAGSAQAAVIASTITSPANDSSFFNDTTALSTTALFTVTGTTTGSGNIDIDCYDGAPTPPSLYTIVSNVPVTDNTFSVPVTQGELDAAQVGQSAEANDTCVLRAVDTGDSTDYPPGNSTAFSGPTISLTSKQLFTSAGGTDNFEYDYNGLNGFLEFGSAGSCGLGPAIVFAPSTLSWSNESFDCVGAIYDPGDEENGSNLGGEIHVDGVEALDSDAAVDTLSGYQGIALTDSFDPATDTLTVHDDEPILDCEPSYSDCTSYASSGVALDRTWQTEDGGEAATQTDVFRSVDGKAHTLTVDEDDDLCSQAQCTTGGSAPGSFEFPGSSSFTDYAEGATVTLPTNGPGTILFKTDSSTPDAGDGLNPQGAITYASPPNNGPVLFTFSDENDSHENPEFVLPYSRSIPAGGSVALRFAYIQDYALSGVESQAQATIAGYSPTVAISSPANGATVREAAATVSGTVNDAASIKSLTVNGTTVSVQSNGSWSATVKLVHGSNPITALVTDSDDLTGQGQVTITNAAAAPALTIAKAGKITAGGARVSGTVNPEGLSTSYQFQYGTKTSYGSQTGTASAGLGTSSASVEATLTKLKPATTYYYRLTATNALGQTDSSRGSFRTALPSPTGLGAKVSPKTARHFPYVFMAKGKLGLPKGVAAKTGCTGEVTLTVSHGKHKLLTARAKITHGCTWSTKLKLTKHSAVAGTGKLAITPSFPGDGALGSLTAKPVSVRYG
jgi:Glucodextranase, domain B